MISPEASKFGFLFRLFIRVFTWFFKLQPYLSREKYTSVLGEIQDPSAALLVQCVSDQSIGFHAHFSFLLLKENIVYWEITGEFLFNRFLIFNTVIWNVYRKASKGHSTFLQLKSVLTFNIWFNLQNSPSQWLRVQGPEVQRPGLPLPGSGRQAPGNSPVVSTSRHSRTRHRDFCWVAPFFLQTSWKFQTHVFTGISRTIKRSHFNW